MFSVLDSINTIGNGMSRDKDNRLLNIITNLVKLAKLRRYEDLDHHIHNGLVFPKIEAANVLEILNKLGFKVTRDRKNYSVLINKSEDVVYFGDDSHFDPSEQLGRLFVALQVLPKD